MFVYDTPPACVRTPQAAFFTYSILLISDRVLYIQGNPNKGNAQSLHHHVRRLKTFSLFHIKRPSVKVGRNNIFVEQAFLSIVGKPPSSTDASAIEIIT